MKKIWIIIGITAVSLIMIGLGIFIWTSNSTSKKVSIDNSEKISPTPISAIEALWDDQAGFTFKYNSALKFDKHDEDTQNYAHIEFVDANHAGSIIVWAKDTTAVDLAAWVKTEKVFQGANVIDTTLAGQPAKKIMMENPVKTTITGTISDGIVFTVEGKIADQTFWMPEYDRIINSFQFKQSGQAGNSVNNSGDNSGDTESVDEEETLQ